MSTRILVTMAAILLAGAGCSRKPAADGAAENERKFEEMMTGVTLVGHSTSTTREGLGGEERYAIDKVSKLAGDIWLLQARIKYGSIELAVPLPVHLKWARATPVITLTDLSIPPTGPDTA